MDRRAVLQRRLGEKHQPRALVARIDDRRRELRIGVEAIDGRGERSRAAVAAYRHHLPEMEALPLRLAGAADAQIQGHVGELLAWLGLGEVVAKRPPELSMGQRQLVAVGRAVVGRPQLLLADEPTSSVDDGHARRIMHLLLSLHRIGTTIVVATHNDDLVRRHRFPVLEMARGRLTARSAAPAVPAMA